MGAARGSPGSDTMLVRQLLWYMSTASPIVEFVESAIERFDILSGYFDPISGLRISPFSDCTSDKVEAWEARDRRSGLG